MTTEIAKQIMSVKSDIAVARAKLDKIANKLHCVDRECDGCPLKMSNEKCLVEQMLRVVTY